jgi:Ca2+-binding RTX toxin-like protein
VANILGTEGDDNITGTAGDDLIELGPGRDIAHGGDGDDIVGGFQGDDELYGDAGDDLLDGQSGSDRLFGGDGNDYLWSDDNDGVDYVAGGRGNDRYIAESVDVLIELAGEGYDIVERFYYAGPRDGLYVMPDNIEEWHLTSNGLVGDFSYRIQANSSDNLILGFENIENIHGGGGNDSIYGFNAEDLLWGDEGDDYLNGGEHDDQLFGGVGDDRLAGESGNDLLEGGDGNDFLDGGSGNNVLRGDAGNDIFGRVDWGMNGIAIARGVDQMYGLSGNDTYYVDHADDQIFEEGTGVDSVVLFPWGQTTYVLAATLENLSVRDVPGFNGPLNLTGNALANAMFGNSGSNQISGLGGDDILRGEGGDDLLLGGDGDDILAGGVGDDRIEGGAGNDSIFGNAPGSGVTADGLNVLLGGAGDDIINGGAGDDLIVGGAGADYMEGNEGVDTVSYADSSEGVRIAIGGAGSGGDAQGDTLSSIEIVIGSAFADTIYAPGPQTTQIDGGDGNDRLYSTGSAITLRGGAGDDTLSGLIGGTNTQGAVLDGGDGNDLLISGSAADDIRGGAGIDTVSYDNTSVGVTVDLSTGTGSGGAAQGDTFTSIENVFGTGSNDVLIGNDEANILGGDTLTSGAGNDRLSGRGGNDVLLGHYGDDILDGGTGDDVLNGGVNNDTLDGGEGLDTAVFAGPRSAYTITTVNGVTTVSSGPQLEGTDTLVNVEWLRFSDQVVAVNPINGTAAADRLSGGAGSDVIYGFAGNDLLTGGAGSDFLDGGDGVDTAVYIGIRRQYGTVNATTVSGGPEGGADTLSSIENIRFVDGMVTYDVDSASAQVMRLYQAALGRVHDQSGLEGQAAWITAGTISLLSLANAFVSSAEFQSRFGALTNQAFVEQLYQFSLHRNGDAAGVQNWVNALNAGMSRGQVVLEFSESQEHRNLTASTLAQGLWASDAQALIVARLYDATFDRLPDAGGLTNWVNNLKAGVGLTDIAAAFAGSAEFQQRYGALSNQAFIEQLYRFCLNRDGDAAGVQNWVNNLNAGLSRAQVLLEFSESAEHVMLTAPNMLGGIRTVDYNADAVVTDDAAKGVGDAQTLPALTLPGDHAADAGHDAAQTLPMLTVDGQDDAGAGTTASAKLAQPLVLPQTVLDTPGHKRGAERPLVLSHEDDAFVMPDLDADLTPLVLPADDLPLVLPRDGEIVLHVEPRMELYLDPGLDHPAWLKADDNGHHLLN